MRFDFTGAVQQYVVPAGVTAVDVEVHGAVGGSPGSSAPDKAAGGTSAGRLTVTPGETLAVYVGGAGAYSLETGSSGGGATDVRRGGQALVNRVIVAGGGGGRSTNRSSLDLPGGSGGGLEGRPGGGSAAYRGGGGTQTAGGAPGTSSSSQSGQLGVGGDAAPPAGASAFNGGGRGGVSGRESFGGGGGGYYGGGGGRSILNDGGGGGGGSGYIGGVTDGTTTTGTSSGPAYATIEPFTPEPVAVTAPTAAQAETAGAATADAAEAPTPIAAAAPSAVQAETAAAVTVADGGPATPTAPTVVETQTAGDAATEQPDPEEPEQEPGQASGTEVRNRADGRHRKATAVAVWEPPVDPIPAVLDTGDARDVAQAFGPVSITPAGPVYDVTMREARRPHDRIVIGGRDVTYFRGVATPFPGYQLTEPLMYGPTQITLPQVAAAFERPGVGALRWCRPFATVEVHRVDPDTRRVIAVDYRGLIVSYGVNGSGLTLQVGGELTGRAAMQNRQVPIFTSRHDLGHLAYFALNAISGVRLTPRLGPVTGVTAASFGGSSMLDYIQKIVTMSWNLTGNRWTIMPTGRRGEYAMRRKDRATIHGTVYTDDARNPSSLTRDFTEEPNRVYMTGVTPEGQRVRFGSYPGLKQSPPPPYPYTSGRPFGPGTVDADTDTGDGVTLLIFRLRITQYLDADADPAAGYTARIAGGVRALQRDADLPVTGTVTERTWAALYDLTVTGFSLRWSGIEPAAQRNRVRQWARSGSGALMRRNPAWDPHLPRVDRNVDAGAGFDRSTLREWAETELEESRADNWIGSLTLNLGAIIRGRHDPGDPFPASRVMAARDVRPGMNLWLPNFDGGTLVHVSAATAAATGEVSLDVDTRARDAMEVWEVIARNRESRGSAYRQWLRTYRTSEQTKDALVGWDEVGGILYGPAALYAGRWTVIPVVAGQEGTISRLRLRLRDPSEFAVAVFGRRIRARRLATAIGDPLSEAGSQRWSDEAVLDRLDRDHVMLYAAGDVEEPCGYWPRTRTRSRTSADGEDTEVVNPLTGRWQDDAGIAYRTAPGAPVLWLAVWLPGRRSSDGVPDNYLAGGRIMWPQLEGGV